MQLKALTWNIWCGTYLEEVIAFLKQAQPDIIALQEVLKEENGNTALTIAQALGYECVYQLDMDMPAKFLNNPKFDPNTLLNFGNAVLSKYPIISHQIHDLPQGEDRRPVIQADIKIGDMVLHVFSLHLKHTHQQPLEVQNMQADKLLAVMTKQQSIAMGDFNCLPDSYPIRTISQTLNNTELDHDTPTWCKHISGCSVCQIAEVKYKLDYIFATKDLNFHSFKVTDSSASDHLPVSVLVEIDANQQSL